MKQFTVPSTVDCRAVEAIRSRLDGPTIVTEIGKSAGFVTNCTESGTKVT